jgi:hypothetical protein
VLRIAVRIQSAYIFPGYVGLLCSKRDCLEQSSCDIWAAKLGSTSATHSCPVDSKPIHVSLDREFEALIKNESNDKRLAIRPFMHSLWVARCSARHLWPGKRTDWQHYSAGSALCPYKQQNLWRGSYDVITEEINHRTEKDPEEGE